jgi:DNA integrity scanning protein DisA with diadenylate cyclase activity
MKWNKGIQTFLNVINEIKNYVRELGCNGHKYALVLIDLTDSLLPNDLVSMLTYFSMSGADKDYISVFSWTNLFLAVLRLNNKVIFNPTQHKT